MDPKSGTGAPSGMPSETRRHLDVQTSRRSLSPSMEPQKRATVYFDAEVHQALRLKASASQRSISEVVNEAVKLALAEALRTCRASKNEQGRTACPSSPSFRI